jgi:hypothetical protein
VVTAIWIIAILVGVVGGFLAGVSVTASVFYRALGREQEVPENVHRLRRLIYARLSKGQNNGQVH